MYNINTKVDKPDIGYMEMIADKLMTRGIRLADCDKLMNYYVELRAALKSEIQSKYGIDNPNSTNQIAYFLNDMSNKVELTSKNDIINICYDSENDKWTSKAEALEKLADLGYEFAQDLLDYRHAKKYAESIESIMAAADADGLIHPLITLGKTNRINYSKPGLLTIPKKLLWHLITPYTPGNVLYSVDIKNQEPNILINMTGSKELRFALENKDGLYETIFRQCFQPIATAHILVDTLPENRVYSISELKKIGTISPACYSPSKPMIKDVYYNGERVIGIETVCVGSEKGVYPELPAEVSIEVEKGNIYNVPVEWESADKKYKRANDYTLQGKIIGLDIEIGKAERKEFKTSWLAISYGATIFGIQNTCKTIDGKHVYNYITKINELKEYRDKIDKAAKQGINTIGTVFGTRLYAGDFDDWKKLKRVLLDLPIQGTGSDILSLLIKRFYDYTTEHKLDDKMILYYTRHDELIIEVSKDWIESVGKEVVESTLRYMLEHQVDNWTPFQVEVEQVGLDELSANFDEE